VAVAFADSSIVVLALPSLYTDFHTSLIGVSWVITSYNLVVFAAAFALVPFTRRLHVREVTRVGLALFTVGSIGCAAAWGLSALIVFRCVQGLGGALLLAGALPMLGGLLGGATRGARVWTATGTFGAALGPALGGVLTQLAAGCDDQYDAMTLGLRACHRARGRDRLVVGVCVKGNEGIRGRHSL